MFGSTGDAWLTVGWPQMAPRDPDTQEAILEGTAGLVDCIKAPVRSVHPEKGEMMINFRLKGVVSRGSAYRIHHDHCWPFQIIQYARTQVN